MNPDMFGANSVNACSDLLQVLGEDASTAVTSMMRDIAAELADQDSLVEVMHELTRRCYDQVRKCCYVFCWCYLCSVYTL